jgi:drug/metabolite transporter (DMT)-like permease
MLNGVPGGSALGNALVLGNAVAQSFQIVAMERFAPRYDARALTFLQMAVACLAFTRSPSRGVSCDARGRIRLVRPRRHGRVRGALGYLVATWVQSRTTAARAALVFTLEAPFAALFGVLLLSERLGVLGWTGCAVMLAGIILAEPAAAATLRRLARATRRRAVLMDAVVLALCSAALFGAMTVALRPALARGDDPLCGALFTVIPALGVALVAAVIAGDWNVAAVWPFALAGILGPGVSQVLFTDGDPATPARRAPPRQSAWHRSSPSRSRPCSSVSRSRRGSPSAHSSSLPAASCSRASRAGPST